VRPLPLSLLRSSPSPGPSLTLFPLADALAALDSLKRDLVTHIHRRFVALQKQHRAHLCALAQANDARELAERASVPHLVLVLVVL